MRIPIALAAVALLAAAPALAQGSDLPGCIQANPCEVIVDLDAQGIELHQDSFSRGDWILLSVFNDDDVNHTLTVEGKGISVTLESGDINDTRPFELSSVGTVTLKDAPTGDTAAITVTPEESFSGSTSGGASKGGPALGPVVVLGALVALAVLLRRRA